MSEEEQRAELRRFLKDRRARVSPAEAGLPATSRRRVRGLRREEVASLAGVGVSWYTALENGDAQGVSEATLSFVADALRLSESERQYLLALAGHLRTVDDAPKPGPLVGKTIDAIVFPAYIIAADWNVVQCNATFRRVWNIGEGEVPFNAVDRLFLDPRGRELHGQHFIANLTPIVAMLHSSLGRRPTDALRELRERLLADDDIRKSGTITTSAVRCCLIPPRSNHMRERSGTKR